MRSYLPWNLNLNIPLSAWIALMAILEAALSTDPEGYTRILEALIKLGG